MCPLARKDHLALIKLNWAWVTWPVIKAPRGKRSWAADDGGGAWCAETASYRTVMTVSSTTPSSVLCDLGDVDARFEVIRPANGPPGRRNSEALC